MRRQIMVMGALLALAACGENAGWNPNYRAKATPYGDYLRARESALMGRREDPPRIVPVTLPVKAPTPEQISGHSMRPVPEATLSRTRKPVGAPSIDPYPSEPVLADRKTVAAGAVVVAPVAVVTAPAGTTLQAYAVANAHRRGTRVYARPVGYGRVAADPQLCASYADPAAAQAAFIAKGGPAVDPLGLDPDGDGFVCGWDPAPYRAAAK